MLIKPRTGLAVSYAKKEEKQVRKTIRPAFS